MQLAGCWEFPCKVKTAYPHLGGQNHAKGRILQKERENFLLDFHCQQKKGEISISFQPADKG